MVDKLDIVVKVLTFLLSIPVVLLAGWSVDHLLFCNGSWCCLGAFLIIAFAVLPGIMIVHILLFIRVYLRELRMRVVSSNDSGALPRKMIRWFLIYTAVAVPVVIIMLVIPLMHGTSFASLVVHVIVNVLVGLWVICFFALPIYLLADVVRNGQYGRQVALSLFVPFVPSVVFLKRNKICTW